MFQLVACNLAVLAIAMIYYAWRDSYLARVRGRATRFRSGSRTCSGWRPTSPPDP